MRTTLRIFLGLDILIASITLSAQSCNNLETAITYIESSLVMDMHYYTSWEVTENNKELVTLLQNEGIDIDTPSSKKDIKEPLLWYMDERIDVKPGGANTSCKVKSIKLDKPKQKTSIDKANYLLFFSDVINNQLKVKLLYNRMQYNTMPIEQLTFEKLSRQNGGMVYLFEFESTGCVKSVSKNLDFRD